MKISIKHNWSKKTIDYINYYNSFPFHKVQTLVDQRNIFFRNNYWNFAQYILSNELVSVANAFLR